MFLMIFMAIAVPLIGLIFLMWKLEWKFKDPIGRQKNLTYLGVTVGFGIIVALLMYVGGTRKQMFNEVWNYKAQEVRFYERWNERVSCSHPTMRTRTVTRTDSKGKTYTTTEQYQDGWDHPYDVDDHPEYRTALTEYGGEERISHSTYEKWATIFTGGKKIKKDMHRDYHTIDGDMYYSTWNGEFEKMFPLHSIHTYKNKVRVSDSIFKYAEPSEELVAKYPRPADQRNTNPIIGPGVDSMDQLLLRRLNAKYGSSRQIHNIVYLTKESRYAVDEILSAWQGVNKNELVTFIGIDDDMNVKWCDVQSWMDNTEMHSAVSGDVVSMGKFTSRGIFEILEEHIGLWERKQFADFEYLKVPISAVWFIVNLFLSIAICVITVIVIHKNFESGRSYISRLKFRSRNRMSI
jgi:hypothetical protein